MSRTRAVVAGAALAFVGLLCPAQALAAHTIVPPRRLDAIDVPYPQGGQGDATVVLVVLVDASGGVQDVTVREGTPPFADAAVAGVRAWRFAPATRDDEPIPSRIVAKVTFHAPVIVPARAPPVSPPPVAAPASAFAPPVEVTVQGEREEPSTIHIPRSEAQFVAGAFADPFKVVEALPGMAPWLSGLPYYYVRGSEPESVGYFVDGIRVPLLFHVGPGPSTISPSLVDTVDLFPGAYPARYGRYAGAVIAGETTAPQADRLHGDFSARVYDANAFVETPFDDHQGTVMAAGRYSYTGPLISLVVPNYSLAYWDYQFRVSHKIGDADTLSLFAFGAYDELHYYGQPSFRVEYHRVDLRYDHKTAKSHVRVAFTYNYDDTLTALETDNGTGANAALKGPGWRLRAESEQHVTDTALVRAGADMSATAYRVDQYPPIDGFSGVQGPHTDVEGGAYGDVVWRPSRPIEIVPGFRFDGYRTRGETAWAPQPRLAARIRVLPSVVWLSSFGTAHQEPTEEVFVPAKLPNPIDQASQTNYQFSEGAEVRLPSSLRFRVTGFYNRLLAQHILGTDETDVGQTAGLELFVRRDFTERLGGFFSYTLSRTVGTVDGVTERVSWDRTHVASLVLGYDLGHKWRLGARVFFESGRPYQPVCVQDCGSAHPISESVGGNLPIFWRLDARLEKRWSFSGDRWLGATLECFNVFDKAEPVGDEYVPGHGLKIDYQSAIILPSIGVEGGM
jgi:TonB family protein